MLVPVNSSSGISAALGSYSGLAGIAGISLPTGSDEGNSLKATQKIRSLSFFENNIMPYISLPDLMAIKSWNSKTNTLVFDYIDPPAVMEEKSEPKRALICILSALLGGMLSVLFVLIRNFVIKQKVT